MVTIRPCRHFRTGFLTLFLAFCSAQLATSQTDPSTRNLQPNSFDRIIVLGVDGLDPTLLKRYFERDELPHLRRLADTGHFSRLETTNPAQSPVSWASGVTGQDPGKTRVFGFLRRPSGSYEVESVLYRSAWKPHPLGTVGWRIFLGTIAGLFSFGFLWVFLRWALRLSPPRARGTAIILSTLLASSVTWILVAAFPTRQRDPLPTREGTPFWQSSLRAGIDSTALFAPMSYPSRPGDATSICCGFGVPDLHGTPGIWTLFSSESLQDSDTASGGRIVRVTPRNGLIETHITGPWDPKTHEQVSKLHRQLRATPTGPRRIPLHRRLSRLEPHLQTRLPLGIRIEKQDQRILLTIDDTEHSIPTGTWSPWIPVTFPAHLLGIIPGQLRFRLISLDPFLLYMTPLQIDPSRPPVQAKLSFPRNYADEIARRSGSFPTLGWASATNPLKDELIDETVFLESAWSTFESRRRIVLEELRRFEKGLHASFLYVPDRICHMMWRLTDRQSPRFDEDLARRHGDAICEAYRRIDRLVGEIVKQFVDERTLFLLFSDHGFAPFRYGVHLNTWLERAGYLVLRTPSGVQYAHPTSGDLSEVDWTQTRAYSLGLGKIFLNLQGREPQGIVPPQDAAKLASAIAHDLTAYRHKRFGRVISRVDRRETLFRGPYVDEAADLFVSFRRGFRVSWETSLGGFGPQIVVPNPLKWSGDHASVDPALVPGTFLSNRPLLRPSSIRLLDIGPTILRAIGVEPSEAVDGTIHLFQTNEESHERHP